MNDQTNNPWLQRLPVYSTDAELIERMKAPIQRVQDLSGLPAGAARNLLDMHLDSVYVPTSQGLKLTRRVLESGFAHCYSTYKTTSMFVQRLMNTTAKCNGEPETWMITGDAGIGKTATINALKRLLGEAPYFQATADCPSLPIIGGAFLTLKPGSVFADLLNQLAAEIGYSIQITNANSHAKRALRNEIHKRGVFFVLLDESQVAAVGKSAGAAYVRNLMLLRDLGIPLIYACNYSMVHGMLGQHAQNQQRLLMNPFVFRSVGLSDPDLIAMIEAYVEACDGLLKIDMPKDIEEIHRLTDGRGRPLRLLIVTAYNMQRSAGITKVNIGRQELQEAYCSESYSALRREIETINKHRVEKSGLRSDLFYPLELENDTQEAARRAAKDALAAAAASANLRNGMPRAKDNLEVSTLVNTLDEAPRRLGVGGPQPAKQVLAAKSEKASQSPRKPARGDISDQDVDDAWT